MNIKLDYSKLLGLDSNVETLSKIGQEMIVKSDKERTKLIEKQVQKLNKIGDVEA